MVNKEPEQEPPSVPEDVALTPSTVQQLPRGCNQTHRMPTVVRIPPRECDRPRLTATGTPRIRRNWSTWMAHRPPPAATTTSSRLSHCAEGREREERRLRRPLERPRRTTVSRSKPSSPPRSFRVPASREVRSVATRPRHGETRSNRLVQPASFRIAIPTPSSARVVTARDARGRQGLLGAHLLSQNEKKNRRYRVWHAGVVVGRESVRSGRQRKRRRLRSCFILLLIYFVCMFQHGRVN